MLQNDTSNRTSIEKMAEAGAVFAAIGNVLGDTQGAVTKTSEIQLSSQLAKFTARK
ncbi:MAG: hypothetical protein HC834_08070 [Rhodospirillales bacterium]|nr:hypothetical protein [Rhodospirillales bacterium]